MEYYKINDPEGRFLDRGSPSLPFLHNISPGCRNNQSLIFHLQLGVDFFVHMTIKKVTKKHVTFRCVTRKLCNFSAKMKVNPKFVKVTKNAISKGDGKFQAKFEIDLSNPELRDISVWTVIETPGAKACSFPQCRKPYFSYVQKDYREVQGNRSLGAGQVRVEETLTDMGLPQTYGPEFCGSIINKNHEKKSSRQKIQYYNPVASNDIPDNVKFIMRSDFTSPTLELSKQTFLQKETENSVIFFLEEELIFLERYPWFGDGTFSIIRNTKHSQAYLISILFEEHEKTFAYPVAFIFMKNKKSKFYKEIFEFINAKFEEIHKRPLIPKSFHIDCESSVMKALRETYENPNIRLCTTHILRNFNKTFIKYGGKNNFLNDQILQDCWNILKGIFFLPTSSIPLITSYLLSTAKPKLKSKILQNKFSDFVEKYLLKNYF